MKRVMAECAPSDEELDIVAEGSSGEDAAFPTTNDIGVKTTECFDDYYQLKEEVTQLKARIGPSLFEVLNINLDSKKIQFYTGFPNYNTLVNCYIFLGPAVNCLNYWGSGVSDGSEKSSTGRSQCLPPVEEFFCAGSSLAGTL